MTVAAPEFDAPHGTTVNAPLAGDHTPRKLAVVVALAALADWLFYGHAVGLSAVLFLLALDLGVVLANPRRARGRELKTAVAVLAASLAPLAVEPGLIAALFGVVGVAYAAVIASGRPAADWTKRMADCAILLRDCCWQAIHDLCRAGAFWSKADRVASRLRALVMWIVPLSLGAVFLSLFASANPLIEGWLAAIDVAAPFADVGMARIGFWLVAILFSWPFLFLRERGERKPVSETGYRPWITSAEASGLPPQFFGKGAILRSLVLFNLMFAAQSGLDVAYLWGGVALPDGMTYAAYAHRGAYPLIVTALLAAGFVIAATWPGGEAVRSPAIRALVYAWTGQTLLLVVSAILRLDLYVQVYALSYWRIAAFIWMLLVALGLILILARVQFGLSNAWLIRMNLASLAATLYLSCFLDFPGIVATYNVAHSREYSGHGVRLDMCYLANLGPRAIPGLDLYIARLSRRAHYEALDPLATAAIERRDTLAAEHRELMMDWRAWNYRDWQLARYLAKAEPPG